MCGIFGVSGKKGKSVNIQKLIILGLYNETRGKDSCGYYFNGNVQKGINLNSDFHDFIINNKIEPGELKAKTFMGHTRKATLGAHTLVNAHPHVVNNDYVQTHNGTIKNVWELCNKHNVSHTGVTVDSVALANLMYKLGPKEVLESYTGLAALAFTWMSDPEALYLYRGASREKKDGVIISERPLYFLDQPEGLYYSSMIEPLTVINSVADGPGPLMLKSNTVYKFVNGVFVSELAIEREEQNITPVIVHSLPPSKASNGNNFASHKRWNAATSNLNRVDDDDNADDLVIHEPAPMANKTRDLHRVAYYRGRYHQILYSEKSGLYTALLYGECIINRAGFVIDAFTGDPNEREDTFYFIGGIMMKSKDAYDDLKARNLQGDTEETFKILSTKSKYPIFQIKNHLGIGKNRWFHHGTVVWKETIHPKFSKKHYKVRDGKTIKISELEIVKPIPIPTTLVLTD